MKKIPRFFHGILLIALFTFPVSAEIFRPKWISNGYVMSLITHNNSFVLGGNFNKFWPNKGSLAAIDLNTGNRMDSPFNCLGEVSSIIGDGTGGWYVAGDMREVLGIKVGKIIHINPDLSLDTTYHPEIIGDVSGIALYQDKLVVTGDFEFVNGLPRRSVACLDRNGRDTGLSIEPGANDLIQCMMVANDRLYIGGYISQVNGQARGNGACIRLNDGALEAWDPRVTGNRIQSFAYLSGTVYVAGDFTAIQGSSRKSFAALDEAGNLLAWNPNVNYAYYFQHVAASGAGIYITGGFNYVAGVLRNGCALVDPHTGALYGWNPSLPASVHFGASKTMPLFDRILVIGNDEKESKICQFNTAGNAINTNILADTEIWALYRQGNIALVGGMFNGLGNDYSVRTTLAAFNTQGDLLPALATISGTADTILAMVSSGPKLYVAGGFSTINGLTRKNIACFEGVSYTVTSWTCNMPLDTVNGIGLSGDVLFYSGRDPLINIGDTYVLKGVSTTSGTDIGLSIKSKYPVLEIIPFSNKVYLSGRFTSLSGVYHQSVARMSLNGSLDTWNPLSNTSSYVYAMRIGNGNLHFGGDFSQFAGATRGGISAIDGLDNLATWDANLKTNSSYNNASLKSMVFNSGKLFCTGFFNISQNQERSYQSTFDSLGQLTDDYIGGLDDGLIESIGSVFCYAPNYSNDRDYYPVHGAIFGSASHFIQPDSYEPDYDYLTHQKTPKDIKPNGPNQLRNILKDDSDYLEFDAVAGKVYLIEAIGNGLMMDPVLRLYRDDYKLGVAANDDVSQTNLNSMIRFNCQQSGKYKLTIYNVNLRYGSGTEYTLRIKTEGGEEITPAPVISPKITSYNEILSYPNPIHAGDKQVQKLAFAPVDSAQVVVLDRAMQKVAEVPAAQIQVSLGLAAWVPRDNNGKPLAPGLYLLVLTTNKGKAFTKMTIVK
jgi:hypothetical protein